MPKTRKILLTNLRSLDFTVDQENFAGLPDFVRDIQSMGHKFVTILDPGLSRGEPSGSYPSFEAGQENNVWIVGEDGEPVTGKVWPEHPVYYVDFTKPEAKTWWKNEIVKFHGLVPWDGLWIDMNEPSNMVISIKPLLPTIFRLQEMWMMVVSKTAGTGLPTKLTHLATRYQTGERCFHFVALLRTVCGDALQHAGRHYDLHNIYGWSQV